MTVTLQEITRDGLDAMLALDVAPYQKRFVGSVAKSIAQAHYYPEIAWYRGIYAGDTPIGFAMLALEPERPPYLWRFLIDARFQGRGLGCLAMERILEAARSLRPAATEIRLSHVEGEGHPGPFYERLGFAYTGEIDDGEHVMWRAL